MRGTVAKRLRAISALTGRKSRDLKRNWNDMPRGPLRPGRSDAPPTRSVRALNAALRVLRKQAAAKMADMIGRKDP